MKRCQRRAAFKVLSCVFALSLVFGLSAVPALAVQGDESSADTLSAQAGGAEDQGSTVDGTQPTSSGSSSTTNKSASWNEAGSTSSKTSEETQTTTEKKTDVLNPVEKFGAVLEGERQAAVENATGIVSQEYDELDLEGIEDEEQAQKAEAALLITQSLNEHKSQFDTYAPTPPSVGASVKIIKDFSGTISTMEGVELPSYTAVFAIQGQLCDRDGNPAFTDPQGHYYYYEDGMYFSLNEEASERFYVSGSSVVDWEDNVIYEDPEGNAYRVQNGVVHDYWGQVVCADLNSPDGAVVYCKSVDGTIYPVTEDAEGVLFVNDEPINLDENDNMIDREEVLASLSRMVIAPVVVDVSSFEPAIVYPSNYSKDHQWEYVGINIASATAAAEIEYLPYPVLYTVKEITYDESGHICSSESVQSKLLRDSGMSPLVFEFSDTDSGATTPNEGIVNRYILNGDSLSASKISIKEQLSNAENSGE
jgi:hypothetical protein